VVAYSDNVDNPLALTIFLKPVVEEESPSFLYSGVYSGSLVRKAGRQLWVSPEYCQ
jgi:hypothetical protein